MGAGAGERQPPSFSASGETGNGDCTTSGEGSADRDVEEHPAAGGNEAEEVGGGEILCRGD